MPKGMITCEKFRCKTPYKTLAGAISINYEICLIYGKMVNLLSSSGVSIVLE